MKGSQGHLRAQRPPRRVVRLVVGLLLDVRPGAAARAVHPAQARRLAPVHEEVRQQRLVVALERPRVPVRDLLAPPAARLGFKGSLITTSLKPKT